MPRDLLEQAIGDFRRDAGSFQDTVARSVIGQPELVRQILIAAVSGGHVLVEGLPGLGKTEAAKAASGALGARVARVQGMPDLMPSDILGSEILKVRGDGSDAVELQFVPGPVFSELLIVDEINRAPPKSQSALLEAMQERQVTIAGETRALPDFFMVIATQNTVELEGTFPLPEAQLDRFFCKSLVRYPDRDTLLRIAARGERPPVPALAIGPGRILDMARLTDEVVVAPHVQEAAADLILSTHPDRPEASPLVRSAVRFGVSPRGLQSLLRAARAEALLNGRIHAAIEDLTRAAPPVLRHRIFLNLAAELDGVTPDDVLQEVLAQRSGA